MKAVVEDSLSLMLPVAFAVHDHVAVPLLEDSPFDLENSEAYSAWRQRKLATLVTDLDELTVEIEDLENLTDTESRLLRDRICQNNLVRYRCQSAITDRHSLRLFTQQLGLRRVDTHLCADHEGFSAITVDSSSTSAEYIPYTDKPLSWHCDGYYNLLTNPVRAMLLHCVRPAAEGGENSFIDHELIYIMLRDQNPEWIAALMHPEAFTIPENVQSDVCLRPDRSGPVFFVDDETGELYMRYTARRRNIHWREDTDTHFARLALASLLSDPETPILRMGLQAGEGVLCHNILHNRSAFRNDSGTPSGRLLFRARFYDRVHAKEVNSCSG